MLTRVRYLARAVSRLPVLRAPSRAFSLPTHDVVGMPALSPTMEAGTIGKWLVKEGDSVVPGDAMAEIETDKASMAFEATDDMVIAKILVTEGVEVKVGQSIMVTVEEAGDVGAFADFEAPVVEDAASATTAPAPAPSAAPAAAAPAPAAAAPVAVAPATAASPPSSAGMDTFAVTASVKTMWGKAAAVGALTNKMAVEQNSYQEKYGHQLHKPLPMPKSKK